MRFEAGLEVVHAVHGVDDSADQQHDGKHRKRRQTLAYWHVLLGSLIDAEEFEDEVGEGSKIGDNDTPRAKLTLVAGKVRGGKQNDNRKRHRGNGQVQLDVAISTHNHHKLNSEPKEEEEIELQQGNVDLFNVSVYCQGQTHGNIWILSAHFAYLIMQESFLHSVIGTNLLENVPCKDLIESPGYPRKTDTPNGQNDRDSDEKGLDRSPQSVSSGHYGAV